MNKKISFLLFVCLCISQLVNAQDYLSGKMTEAGGQPQDILYDRTQMAITANVFKSIYKVMDKNKTLLYSISITEDQQKSSFVIYIRPETSSSKIMTVEYDAAKSGLIFSDQGNTDSVYSMTKSYAYLISFSDATRDYPILHKIKTDDSKEIELDPLSKLRLKRHNELLHGPAPTPAKTNAAPAAPAKTQPTTTTNTKDKDNDITKVAEQRRNVEQIVKDTFSLHILRLRDTLYTRSFNYTRAMNKTIKVIQADSLTSFKSKKPTTETRRYKGKKKSGKFDGKGVLAVFNSIYDGTFKKGAFASGKVALRNELYEYYGDYSKDTFNGMGWLKNKDGSFQLGVFLNGSLYTGVFLANETGGDVYFGLLNKGQKTGYAELHDIKGDLYYGDYLNARLVKGYAKEVDRFGYSTYSKIEKGTKKSIEPEIGEKFFEAATPKK